MIDTDRLRPKISPLDVWRLASSFVFVGFGVYFVVRFLLRIGRSQPLVWSQLLFGVLILLYGVYRLWGARRNYRRMQEELRRPPAETETRP